MSFGYEDEDEYEFADYDAERYFEDGGERNDEPCDHDCDEDCEAYGCRHEHCFNCGGCGCPGYCDDYQTYNLRPEETGGEPDV